MFVGVAPLGVAAFVWKNNERYATRLSFQETTKSPFHRNHGRFAGVTRAKSLLGYLVPYDTLTLFQKAD
jgi:hypothetical protein